MNQANSLFHLPFLKNTSSLAGYVRSESWPVSICIVRNEKSFLAKVCWAPTLLKNWGCGHQIRLCIRAIKLSTTDFAQTTPSENLLLNRPSVCSVCSSLLYLQKTSSPKVRCLRSQICLVELAVCIFREMMQKNQDRRTSNIFKWNLILYKPLSPCFIDFYVLDIREICCEFTGAVWGSVKK